MPTVYITAPEDAARELATGLVDNRMAACVNLVDCDSIYRWEDEVVTDEESILLAKTTDDRYDDLVSFLEREHPYDVPCIERFDEDDVFAPYSVWVRENVLPED